MYEVRVEGGFSAVHQVRTPDGQLEPLHGHDWKVEAVFRGLNLDGSGMLVDFITVQEALRAVSAQFHHTDLNDHALLDGQDPTAERVAVVFFEQLRLRVGEAAPLAAIYVRESPGCVAGYSASAESG